MKNFLYITFFSLAAFFPAISFADWNGDRPDGHAPIGVTGDHVHHAGETMLSYRYMLMDMNGLQNDSHGLSTGNVLKSFKTTPTDMTMEMHMFGLMFAPGDTVTLMAMVPYTELSMNHLTRKGGKFQTNSSGLGDIRLTGLINAYNYGKHRFIINSGVSLPSGSINERDDTPAAKDARLPYPMQLGSGTVDLLPGITYLGQADNFSWGAQGIATLHIGTNDNGYSKGDRFDSSLWGAIAPCKWMSASIRTAWNTWANIDGADAALNKTLVPTADPALRGGQQANLGFGLNFYVPEGPMKSLRLSSEFILPIYQDLQGPQLETDWTWIFGAQMSM